VSRVEVAEHGSRPVLMTPARINAPQGARAIADVAMQRNAADLLRVVIDWEGEQLFGSDNPAAMPIVYIYAAKYFPNIDRTAYIEIPLDMEDAFSQSNFTSGLAQDIVDYIIEQFEQKAHESYSMKGNN
jgi:hypothetical protein